MSDQNTIQLRIGVEAWFRANPQETLTAEDIAHKFVHHHSTIHTKLAPLVQNGTLALGPDKHGEQVYSAGPGLGQSSKRKRPTPSKAPADATPEAMAAIPVEKQKPQNTTGRGADKWAPLFQGLDEPDDSKAIPAEWHVAVGCQAYKRNKKAGHKVYAVRRINDTQSRLYRIAK